MKISLYFYSIPQYLKCLSVIHEADFIYLPYEYFSTGSTKSKGKMVYMAGPNDTISYNAEELSKEKYFMTFPYVLKGNAKDQLYRNLDEYKCYTNSFLLQNLGDINACKSICKDKEYRIHADYSFNVQNSASMDALYNLGVQSVTLSPELKTEKLAHLAKHAESDFLVNEKYAEILCYGRLILMCSEHCYISDEQGYKCGKCLKEDEYTLKDKDGNTYPVLANPTDCRSIMLDRMPLMIKDNLFLEKMRDLRSCILRLNIYNEDASQVSALIKYFKYGLPNNEIEKMKPYSGQN